MIGLPSLRALDGSQAARIWLSAEATDMRCGFDRLAERVRVATRGLRLSPKQSNFSTRAGTKHPNPIPKKNLQPVSTTRAEYE
jgi:transposase